MRTISLAFIFSFSILGIKPCFAEDNQLCKEMCVSDKTQCKKQSDVAEWDEKMEPIIRQNPQQVRNDFSTERDNQKAKISDASKKRFERNQICESDYLLCSGRCQKINGL